MGVNLDHDGDLILMRRFIARYKPVFPNFRKKAGGEDAFVQAVLPGWGGAIPASFFYAKDGRQIGHLLGANDRATYEAAIRSLLASNDECRCANEHYGFIAFQPIKPSTACPASNLFIHEVCR